MLIQEVFFHLVGAIEVFAQLVNEQRNLSQSSEDVSVSKIAGWLPAGDPLIDAVDDLYANPRGQPLPADPHADDGLLWRIWNYRHQVTHRMREPLELRAAINPAFTAISPEPSSDRFRRLLHRGDPPTQRSAHLILDPRDPASAASDVSIDNELAAMCDLVESRLNAAIQAL